VREAAVISFEDEDDLTKSKAFVVLRESFQPSAEIIAALNETVQPLGGYKLPAAYKFIAELPRTTLLKIDRRALRALDAAKKA
jgi:benzoate-CoA ligase